MGRSFKWIFTFLKKPWQYFSVSFLKLAISWRDRHCRKLLNRNILLGLFHQRVRYRLQNKLKIFNWKNFHLHKCQWPQIWLIWGFYSWLIWGLLCLITTIRYPPWFIFLATTYPPNEVFVTGLVKQTRLDEWPHNMTIPLVIYIYCTKIKALEYPGYRTKQNVYKYLWKTLSVV